MRLVDTSVAIDHLRGDPKATSLLQGALRNGEKLAASEVTRFELLMGVRDEERERLERFFASLAWCPVDQHVARLAGAFARRYRRSHGGIDTADYLIAATAQLLEAPLLTMNVRHYPMLEGLGPAY